MVAQGIVSYPANDAFLKKDDPVTIAVTGGTIDYFGATGQVTSKKITDAGAHTHTFELYYLKYNAKSFEKLKSKSK